MINVDHDFQIGKEHIVCEDYALSGLHANKAIAIVCDGCSASPDVDVGARLLALSARQMCIGHGYMSFEPFAFAAAHKAHLALESFTSVHPHCLDATLLVAWVEKDEVHAYMHGDGVLVHKRKDGHHFIHVEFSRSAPAYPAYLLDDERKKGYLSAQITKTVVEVTEVGRLERVMTPFEPMKYNVKVEEGDVIAVISDGINSFRRANNEPIPWEELVNEFTGYKNTTGLFAKRRIAAFKRQCAKEGTTHSDDISIAAIVV
jgi:hypothetical protein